MGQPTVQLTYVSFLALVTKTTRSHSKIKEINFWKTEMKIFMCSIQWFQKKKVEIFRNHEKNMFTLNTWNFLFAGLKIRVWWFLTQTFTQRSYFRVIVASKTNFWKKPNAAKKTTFLWKIVFAGLKIRI